MYKTIYYNYKMEIMLLLFEWVISSNKPHWRCYSCFVVCVFVCVCVCVYFFLVQKYKEFASAFIGNWFLTVLTNTNKRLNKFKKYKKNLFFGCIDTPYNHRTKYNKY